jgi:hypothetical protein
MKKRFLAVCFLFCTAVLLLAEDIDGVVKTAVDGLASRLLYPMEVSIGGINLAGTESPTAFSRYLSNRILAHAPNNRMFRVVPQSRGGIERVSSGGPKKGLIEGVFLREGGLVRVTLRLATDPDGAVLDTRDFSVSAEELERLGIAIEPENPKARDDLNVVMAALAGDGETDRQSPAVPGIHIQAWFDSESRTYMYRDPLNMTVMADRNCYFKIIHIDVNNQMKMIYPNSYDRNNYLRANVPRSVFENAGYMIYEPCGTETILVVASATQFNSIEQEFLAPWTACTAESLRTAIVGSRGGDLEAPPRPILFTGEGEARYSITILKPHEEYEYGRPANMAEAVQTMGGDIVQRGGFFEGSETSGYGILNNVRTSYHVPRDRPDTVRFAVYYLDSFSGGPGAGVRTRGQGFSFSFARPGDIGRAVDAVRSGIERKGGAFNGNERQGSFRASGIAGQYQVSGMVNVTITEKPLLIPNSLIEKEVKNYFGGN